MKKPIIRWAVTGSCGLYIGQWLRRADAIAEHVSQKQRIGEPELSPFARGRQGGLDDQQKAMTELAERAAKQIARAERLDNVSAKEAYRTILEAIVSARLAAKPADDGVREARDAFLNMICDAHRWEEDVDGDEEDGRTRVFVTYTIVTGHSQLEELASALGIRAPFGETIKATIDLEIEKDIAALTTKGPKP